MRLQRLPGSGHQSASSRPKFTISVEGPASGCGKPAHKGWAQLPCLAAGDLLISHYSPFCS